METFINLLSLVGSLALFLYGMKIMSEGLEKFAAIGETIGLSYEYATSSLATIVAQTRQAPETVGTALKTIFARVQGLSLGETLDDGTNLNKYSEALDKVGINIFDTKISFFVIMQIVFYD